MAINKVEFDGQTLIDLTGDTVTQQDVLNGKSFHSADGVQRSGTASVPVSDVTVDGTSVVTNGVAEVVSDNLAPTVTEASSRTNLAVGDSLKTIIGKIKKFFSDLKTVAFTGSYNDLSDKPTIPDISTKVSKSGDTMTGTLNAQVENNVCVNLRPGNADYYDTISTQTSGNEAVVFATKNAVTSWIFVNGEDSVTNHANNRWQSLTPALQIKNNCVAIGKLIANATTPSYALDVNGTSMFTSANDTPMRIKTTTTAKCYLGFYNNSALLGYYAVGTDKLPYFEPAGGSDVRLLTGIETVGVASCSGSGQYSYFKIATLKITGGYVNGPVAFELSQRQYQVTIIQVGFVSTSGTDPALSYFITNGTNNYYIKKTATSTWEVYGKYSESWGGCTLHRIVGYRVNNGVSVTVNMSNVADPTSGATQVTYGGVAEYAANVTGTVAIANGGTGATSRLKALENLTNEDVGTSSQYFLTITNSWSKGGYCSVANARTVLGLGSAAYTNSSAYATSGHNHDGTYLKLSGGDMTGSVNFKSGKGINFYNSANNNYSDIYTADQGTTFLRSSHGYINLCTNNQAQVRNFGDTAWKNIAAANISSSRRFKEHIEDMTEEEAKKLLDIRTVTFDFKKEYEPSEDWHECKHQSGVIAEEVLDIYPTLVRFSNYEEPEKEPIPTFVEYSHFVPYLIKMVQMQQKEIDQLKAEVAELKR